MRAVVMLEKKLFVDEVPYPVPETGEVMVKTLACGICGSDLHMLHHAKDFIEVADRVGLPIRFDLDRPVVFGHEFCAEIVDYGPGTVRGLKPGTRVCSVPFLFDSNGFQTVGYSNTAPGGFGEYMRLGESMLIEVPNGLAPEFAALTEPMAVGYHAVEKAQITAKDVPLVIGCGPVGLAVIAALRIKGIGPIVAADFSPRRRELAATLGADIVVDPAERSPYKTWSEAAVYADSSEAPPQLPWIIGPVLRPAVIFECVGLPGIIERIVLEAPGKARIVVVGVCMQPDTFQPVAAIAKELSIQFTMGYTPAEFGDCLRYIAEGAVPVEQLITGVTNLDGAPQAFTELANPEKHAKIIVQPAA